MFDLINNNVCGHIGISLVDLHQWGYKYMLILLSLLLLLLLLERKEKKSTRPIIVVNTAVASVYLRCLAATPGGCLLGYFGAVNSQQIISNLNVRKWQQLATESGCFVCISILLYICIVYLVLYGVVVCVISVLCIACLFAYFDYLHTTLVKVTFFPKKNATKLEQEERFILSVSLRHAGRSINEFMENPYVLSINFFQFPIVCGGRTYKV